MFCFVWFGLVWFGLAFYLPKGWSSLGGEGEDESGGNKHKLHQFSF